MQALWMLVAALLFSLMGVCIKLASAYYGTAEIVFYRSLVGVVLTGLYARLAAVSLHTPYWRVHIRRGLSGVVSMMLWFATLAVLPLATAMTFSYTSPIWLAIFLLLGVVGKRSGRSEGGDYPLFFTILISFVGVICLLQPTVAREQLSHGLLGLLSGAIAAIAYLSVRELGRLGEPEVRTVFYFSLLGTVLGGAAMLFQQVHTHTTHGLFLLGGVGVFATFAQVAMTRAYRLGNGLLAANLHYTGIIFSTGLGMLIWDDHPNGLSWIGMLLIVVSGMVSGFLRFRAHKSSMPAR